MELLILGGTIVYIAFIIGIVVFALNKAKIAHAESQHKLSDAELFKLMAKANHFLTAEQLVNLSTLTLKEAKARLVHLAMQGVLRRFQRGMDPSVFQLKGDVPLINALPAKMDNLSESEIVEIILMHVDDYQVTIAELVVIFGIDIYQAKTLINRLKKHGLLSVLRNGLEHVYVVKKTIHLQKPLLRTGNKKNDLYKMPILEEEKFEIPDADVLEIALQNKGIITPTSLCLKLKIPINEAKLKLEELHELGAFEMDVNETNYTIEYRLSDKSLLP